MRKLSGTMEHVLPLRLPGEDIGNYGDRRPITYAAYFFTFFSSISAPIPGTVGTVMAPSL